MTLAIIFCYCQLRQTFRTSFNIAVLHKSIIGSEILRLFVSTKYHIIDQQPISAPKTIHFYEIIDFEELNF